MRVSHSRFKNHKPAVKGETYDRVVTSAWEFDPETSILTYGATVFTKDYPSDHWNKKKHRQTAIQRFKNNPVYVEYIPEEGEDLFLSFDISEHLIYKFGAYVKTEIYDSNLNHDLIQATQEFSDFCYLLIGFSIPTFLFVGIGYLYY